MPDTPSGPPTETPVDLGRNRDFRLLWCGEAISTAGSQISLVAFPLLVLATTHSPARAGLVGFANQVPVLGLYLPAGVLADRADRRGIMVLSSLLGAVALATVPVALALGRLPFAQILVVAFIAGAREVFYSVAEQGALPLVVDPSQVTGAVTRNQARAEAATIAGPPLGGVLYGIGRMLPFTVDAISYLFAAVAALLVRTPLQEPRSRQQRQHPAREVREALRWLWSQPFIRDAALVVAAANFTAVAIELLLIIRARDGGASAAAIGIMLAMIGAGGLFGALVAPRIVQTVSTNVIVIGLFWFETLLLPPLVLTTNPYLLGLDAGVSAVSGPAWNAVVVGARLTLTPDHLRGRVISSARLISGSLLAAGPLAAGLLAERIGTTDAILAFAAWQLLVALTASSRTSLRTPR